MAPSLQELIDFLLGEVALCGNQGATIDNVLQAIELFYENASQGADANQRRQTVDRRFKAKVWTWLTHHPEVSVGQENEWQGVSLDEAERLDREREDQESRTESDQNPSSSPSAAQIRIFVPRERTWHAIAGHGPDETKIPLSEFVLLSIIAAHRSAGIDQIRLVNLSGQDKRSVPKRTDALKKKGYIEKRAVQIKSARTSLCTHRRFLKTTSDDPDQQKSQIATQDKSMIDFEVFTTQLFDILKKERIVSRDDLKKLLGFQDPWRWKILSRAIRKFERMGVVERVKAESQYEKLHPCIVLRREPTAKDISSFHEFNGGAMDASVDDQADEDEDMELDTVQQVPGAGNGDIGMNTDKHVVNSKPVMPLWTPDRHITNQIFDLIDSSGTKGITNLDINRFCFGAFYRRPSESLLSRLTDCWQISQPLHLRHLAIVRDQDIEKTIIFYRNFSQRNFAERVKAGEASWEAVELSASTQKKSNLKVPGVEATAALDQYGFPLTGPPKGLCRNGESSLYEALLACGPRDYKLTNHDPTVVRLANGKYIIRAGNVKSQPGMTGTSLPIKSQGRPKGSPNKQDSITGSAIRDGLNEEANDSDLEDTLRSLTNRSKAKHDKLKGLSKKERFEAMGMDESWSEYNALLMNKPSPGVYVTPQGKRRPAGKKQGRPRSSRIAVFKSAKLVDLPWFVKEKSDSDHETIAPITEETAVPEEMNGIQASEEPQQVPQPRASRKRTSAFNHTDSPSGIKRPRRVAEKQTKRGDPKDNQAVSSGTDAAISVSEEPALQANVNSTQADVTGKHPLSNEDTRTPTKRQRISSPERADSANFARSPTPAGPSTPMVSDQHGPVEAPKGKKAQTKKTADKSGGSINLLRRKIVMDIVEKAGGAYPSGHEIWYPFVTEWMRMKFKEKPDVRTVKGAVKHLVDAGRIRQLTFSGKDPSGVMVTKTMITKPEMSPDDPLVKEIQAKVLATDRAHPKVSYSPNVFLDPTISKHSSRATGQKHELRVEEGTTVRLQSKPAFVLASEKRRERAFERALYRRMVGPSKADADDDDDNVNIPGAVRLMKIKRPPAAEEFAPGSHTTQTIILRPKRSANPRRQRAGRNQATRRILQKSSSLGHSALLMRPQQFFHSSTGTFATQSIVGRISRQQKNPAAMPDSIHGLSELATSSLHQQDFHSMNDIISEWELDHKHILDAAHPDDPYISQTVRDSFYGTPIGGEIRFDVDRPSRTARPVPTPMQTRKRTEKKQKQQSERRLEAADLSTPARARFQPTLPVPPRTSKRRTFQPIPESLLRKIMLAIVAVRVLTGGTEARHVDWEFVAACFPGHDAPSLIDRARNVLNRNRLQMLKMQSDFQSRFLEAYANDEVPAINYEDLESYPWPTLIEWANFQLEVSTSERAPSLPSNREQFDRIFDLREEPIPTADEIFTTTVGMTVNYRRGVMARTPFAVSLDSGKETKRNSQRQMDLKWEEVTKSFVRANIVTPEETYDPAKSKAILERFGDQRIQFAVDSLIRDRVIGQSNRGRVIPGRNYDITDHLLQQLNRRRLIECGILKHAAQFKTSTLDLLLRDQASAEVQYNAEDGHILAIINLFASGRVQLFPRGAPRDRFGLVDDGYLTRQMDKTKLRFAVDVRPTKSYVYGNPIQERVNAITPPSLSLPEADIPQMIPLWMDLNGHLVEPLWEMSISSVLGSLALRQGLSAKGISSMVKPAMAPWEIEAMLCWLTDVGIVEGLEVESEKRWKVKEWWWMAISR